MLLVTKMVSPNVEKAMQVVRADKSLSNSLVTTLNAIQTKANVKLTASEKAEFLNTLAKATGDSNKEVDLTWK